MIVSMAPRTSTTRKLRQTGEGLPQGEGLSQTVDSATPRDSKCE